MIDDQEKKYTAIYLREIEVGLNNCKTILWVDDNIFDPNWENKIIMEVAQMDPIKNIRFIMK